MLNESAHLGHFIHFYLENRLTLAKLWATVGCPLFFWLTG